MAIYVELNEVTRRGKKIAHTVLYRREFHFENSAMLFYFRVTGHESFKRATNGKYCIRYARLRPYYGNEDITRAVAFTTQIDDRIIACFKEPQKEKRRGNKTSVIQNL